VELQGQRIGTGGLAQVEYVSGLYQSLGLISSTTVLGTAS
jgi:hypothetical protein